MTKFKADIHLVELYKNSTGFDRKEVKLSVYGDTKEACTIEVNKLLNTHVKVLNDSITNEVIYQCYLYNLTITEVNVVPKVEYKDTDEYYERDDMFSFLLSNDVIMVPNTKVWINEAGELVNVRHDVTINGNNFGGLTLIEAIHLSVNG